jgi:hypothetical protein
MDAVVDLENATIKVALVDNTYTFDATDTVWADASGSDLSTATGYTAGGATLGSKTLTHSSGTTTWDAADVTWAFTASKTFRGAVIYVSGTVDSVVNPLIGYVLFDDTPADLTINSVDFTIIWGGSGILVME